MNVKTLIDLGNKINIIYPIYIIKLDPCANEIYSNI